MISESSERDLIDPLKYELVKPSEAARREGVSEKTIYNRIKSGLYKVHLDQERTLVWIKRASERATEREPIPVIPPPATEKPSEVATADIQKMVEGILKLTETISERDSTISTLNNQLATVQNKLIHVRSTEVDEKDLQIQELQTQLQALQKQVNRSPWWKFWS